MENEFEEKYRTLFRRYYAGLSFYAARLVGEDDAEDIVQDVFLEIWKRKDTVELGGQIQSFLYRSVYTRAINVLNHKAVVENYTAEEAELMKKKPVSSENLRRLQLLLDHLHTHYSSPLSLTELSARIPMSRENCCRFFRQMTGRTISGYLNDYRISRGTHLLNTTDLTVSDIASMTGFSSASRFAAAFRTKTGLSPSEYRRNHF